MAYEDGEIDPGYYELGLRGYTASGHPTWEQPTIISETSVASGEIKDCDGCFFACGVQRGLDGEEESRAEYHVYNGYENTLYSAHLSAYAGDGDNRVSATQWAAERRTAQYAAIDAVVEGIPDCPGRVVETRTITYERPEYTAAGQAKRTLLELLGLKTATHERTVEICQNPAVPAAIAADVHFNDPGLRTYYT